MSWIFLIRHYSLIQMLEWVSVKEKYWPSYKRGLYFFVKKNNNNNFLYLCVLWLFFCCCWCHIQLHFWKHEKCCRAESKSMWFPVVYWECSLPELKTTEQSCSCACKLYSSNTKPLYFVMNSFSFKRRYYKAIFLIQLMWHFMFYQLKTRSKESSILVVTLKEVIGC